VSLPRLVATDLDGTLVRSDGTVSPRTREVLAAVEALGVPVVFVTGRPLRWTEPVFEHVGDHGIAVVSNGALVWDVAADRARRVRPIEPDVVRAAAEQLRAAVPGTTYAVESLDGFSLEPEYPLRVEREDAVRRAPVHQLTDAPVLKLLARHETLEPLEYWRQAEDALGETVTVTWSSTTALLEISAPGVTKATTLALVAEELGVAAEDVIAFGDMPNDLPMLRWVGTSYAMADGHPLVRDAAGHVAPGHDQDGVASVLASIFDL
jgi:Cof subfamily protein (haloacid dehalogenase superfamily)